VNYLLDTCVISEFAKPAPNAAVLRWIAQQDEAALYLSALSLGELKRGIEKLDDGKRKTFLQNWLAKSVIPRFQDKIIPLDTAMCLRWGVLQAQLEKLGKPMPVIDGLIAATALQHQLTIVTRNGKDIEASGAVLFDPWAE
jgi:predicted nucleic acid-binding protein